MSSWSKIATVALLLGLPACQGSLDGGPSRSGGPPGTDPDAPRIERGPTPLRALQPDELENVIADVFPEVTRPEIDLAVAREPGRYSTFAASQVVTSSTLTIMEGSFQTVATRLGENESAIGCSVDADGRACIESFARRVIPLLYRRDASPEDVTRVGELFETLRQDDDARTALVATLQAMLMSPYFLYVWSDAEGRVAGSERSRLSGFEIAERLSFLLWSSVPDDALMAAARSGVLDDDRGVRAQAARMMRDPRFDRFLRSFFREWMHLEEIETVTKDPSRIPEWQDGLGAEMEDEAERFFSYWGHEDGTLSGLFTSRRRFLTPHLASFLNLGALGSDSESGVVATDPEQAAGIFTLAAFTASHSRPSSRFGPTLRGHWMRTRLLCGVIGSPPPDALMRAPTEDPAAPTRAWHEELMTNTGCATCHSQMDRLGFSLEHFDGAGRFRELDSGSAVDASAEVLGSGDSLLNGDYDSIADLAPALAESPVVAECLAQHLTEYALGTDQSRATTAGAVSRRSVAIPLVARDLLGPGLHEALLTLVTSEAFLTVEGGE